MLPPLSFVIFAAVKVLSAAMISLVKAYQMVVSPLLGSNCRYTPTCSAYTIEAIKIWGPFKGTWLGMKRISKCHPWGSTGYDPVPKKNQNQINK